MPKEQAEQAEIDPKRHAYWNDPEKGLVGHPVRIEATHQLHCLVSDPALSEPPHRNLWEVGNSMLMMDAAKNLLRRYSYFHYNYTLEYDREPLKVVPVSNRALHVGMHGILLYPPLPSEFHTVHQSFSPRHIVERRSINSPYPRPLR